MELFLPTMELSNNVYLRHKQKCLFHVDKRIDNIVNEQEINIRHGKGFSKKSKHVDSL